MTKKNTKQLKLIAYYIENFKCDLPKFFSKVKMEGTLRKESSADTELYLSKKERNTFAIRLTVKLLARRKKNTKAEVQFEVSMIGFFKRLDKEVSIKQLSKTIAKDMLYEKTYSLFFNILNNLPLKDYQLPPRLKQSR